MPYIKQCLHWLSTLIPLRGILHLMAGRWTVRFIGAAGMMLTARLLTPADFGLMTQAMLLLALVSMLTEFQIGKLLSTLPNPTDAHVNSVFTVQFAVGVLAYGVAAALAYPLALIMSEPRVLYIILLCALEWPIQGLCSPKLQLLIVRNRHKNYALFQIGVKLCQTISVALGALWWHNYNAFVAGTIIMSVAHVALSYVVAPHRARFSLQQWRWAWHNGCYYGSSSISYALTNYLLTASSALLQSPYDAGSYSVAARTANMATSEALYPTAVALFPYLQQQQHTQGALSCKKLHHLVNITAVLALCIAALGVLVSPCWLWIVGEKWRDAVPLLQWCIVAHALHGLSTIWGSILQSTHRARTHAYLQWATVLLLAGGIALCYPFSNANGLVMAALAAGAFNVGTHWGVLRLGR